MRFGIIFTEKHLIFEHRTGSESDNVFVWKDLKFFLYICCCVLMVMSCWSEGTRLFRRRMQSILSPLYRIVDNRLLCYLHGRTVTLYDVQNLKFSRWEMFHLKPLHMAKINLVRVVLISTRRLSSLHSVISWKL